MLLKCLSRNSKLQYLCHTNLFYSLILVLNLFGTVVLKSEKLPKKTAAVLLARPMSL
jgi:hypothetical protein